MYVPIAHVDYEKEAMDTINEYYAGFEKRAEQGVSSDHLEALRNTILELFDEEIRHLSVLRDLCKSAMDVRL